ncbi:MAG: 4Fe-4S dicluster domain-containing protein [bacterium]|nr:4Fe-4S dicluster domain-containing protein [bacterium]
MFGKKDDYSGPEWISRRERFKFVDFQMLETFVRYGGKIKTLDNYCNGCGQCVLHCPTGTTIELVDRKKPIKMGNKTIKKVMRMQKQAHVCGACGVCEAACPRDACYVIKPINFTFSKFKMVNKGPMRPPRLFKKGEDVK